MTAVGQIDATTYQRRQTEKQFMATVKAMAEELGWLAVHFPNALINPTGWPDLILIRGRRTIFAELKTIRGRLGPKQRECLTDLLTVGAEVYVWTPDLWDEIEATLREVS